MEKNTVQSTIDNIIDKTILWAIPYWLKPNFFSYVRIALVPFLYILLVNEHYYYGLIVFIIAACTDFIDGALARKRDQITELGKVLDPIADKLLILTVLLFIGFKYWIVWVFSLFIIVEIILVIAGALLSNYIGRPIGANLYGKIKMVLQSFSVGFFLLGLMLTSDSIIYFSECILVAALFFALLSGAEQIRAKARFLKKDQSLVNLP